MPIKWHSSGCSVHFKHWHVNLLYRTQQRVAHDAMHACMHSCNVDVNTHINNYLHSPQVERLCMYIVLCVQMSALRRLFFRCCCCCCNCWWCTLCYRESVYARFVIHLTNLNCFYFENNNLNYSMHLRISFFLFLLHYHLLHLRVNICLLFYKCTIIRMHIYTEGHIYACTHLHDDVYKDEVMWDVANE